MKLGMSFAIGDYAYGRWGDNRYQKLKSHGYDCADFNMSNTSGELYTADEVLVDSILRREKLLADAAGIKIHQVHGPWRCPPMDATEQDRAERMEKMTISIRAAAMLGCKNWVIHPLMPFGVEDVGSGNEQKTWDINLSFMKELLGVAKEYGVTVCLENMPFLGFSIAKPEDILRFVHEMDDPNFKICLDTGHAMAFGLSIGDEVRRLGREIRTLHVHDSIPGDDLHMIPRMGRVKWEDFADALYEIGFDGVFSIETKLPEGLSDPLFEQACLLLNAIAKDIVKRK